MAQGYTLRFYVTALQAFVKGLQFTRRHANAFQAFMNGLRLRRH
jgi:hypothetical protein